MANFDWVPEEYQGVFSYRDGKLVASCKQCGADRQTVGKGGVLRDIAAGKGQKFLLCGSCKHYKGAKPTKEDIASWPEGHKRCTTCKKIKQFNEFHKHSSAMFGYNTVCKACRVPTSQRHWVATDYKLKMYNRAKSRATKKGREFSITVDDIVIPERCPVLGTELDINAKTPAQSPSLDRIDSSRGYTPDNIIVMSWRANTLKNNMTEEECDALLNFFRRSRIQT